MVNADDKMLSRPPFAVVNSLGPLQVGAEMVACFMRIGARSDRLEYAHELVSRSVGLADSEPLLKAGRAIARDIDRGVGAGVATGYHNGQHLLEVMLTARYLAQLASLDPHRTARVVTAALIHDFHHDGARGTSSPFRLEHVAAREALPYLRSAGVDDHECLSLQALVLATDCQSGVPFALACWAHHVTGEPAVPQISGLPPQLQQLRVDPHLALEAILLTEADILPSIGFTFDHAEELQSRLAAEWGITMGRADKLQFIDRMVENISLATFFIPSIRALRQQYLSA